MALGTGQLAVRPVPPFVAGRPPFTPTAACPLLCCIRGDTGADKPFARRTPLGIRAMVARMMGLIVALGFVALVADCSPGRDPYPCFYSDTYGADRNVDGRTLHWCGPVPRPKN